MLYWDNQKSLLHFPPMPPSGCRLPECIFPMSSQPASHWGGNHKVEKHTERRTHTHKFWCNQEHHQTQMLLLTPDWDTRGGVWGGVGALVTVASTDSGDSAWLFKSVWKHQGVLHQTKLITRWKMVSRGTAQGVAVTCTYYSASLILWHTFFFFPFLLRTWTQFHPPPNSPPVILMMGGSNCALHGRPQGLPLCIWVHSPLKTSRWAPGSEMETPHLAASQTSPGRLLQSKLPLKILVLTKYIPCVQRCQMQFSILSQQTPFDFKKPLMSCFSCIPSSL